MSVLPSFKSAFSSLADAEVSLDVRAADDSGLPAYAPTASIAPHSVQHDRASPTRWHNPQSSDPASPQNDANTLTRSRPNRLPASSPAPSTSAAPPQLSRPNVSLLPLNLLADDAADAPAFGFARNTAKRSSLEPLALDSLAQSDSTPYIQPPQVKTASTLQCPTYKRARTRSVSGRGSYVKHSSSSSDRRSRPPPQASGTHSNSNHNNTANHVKQSSPQPSQQPQSAPKPEPSLSKPTANPKSPTKPPPATRTTHARASCAPLASNASGAPPPKAEQVGDESHRQNSEENKSPPRSIRRGPSSSSLLRGNISKASPPIVSFAPPTFSHRSVGSKANSNPAVYSILQPARFMEDSTSRAPVDVLGSPKQRSTNSAATAKTGLVPNNSAPIISLSGGPTASDFSHLLAHSRAKPYSDDLVDGTDEPNASKDNNNNNNNNNAQAQMPSPNRTNSFQRRTLPPSDDCQRTSPKPATTVQHAAGPAAPNVMHASGTPGVMPAAPERTPTGVPGLAMNSIPPEHSPQEPWRQNPQPVQQKTPSYRLHSDELKTLRMVSSLQKQYSGVEQFTPAHARPGAGAYHLYPNDPQTVRHAFPAQSTAAAASAAAAVPPQALPPHALPPHALPPHALPPQALPPQALPRQALPPQALPPEPARASGLDGAGPSGKVEPGGVAEGGADAENESGSVQCPICPRKLRNQVTLQNHIRVVHDHSGNFQCAQCGLTFMWRSTLGNHVRLVHEKQRPHPCPECGKAFRWKSHLREHCWVVHKGEKPFKCETCGKSFGRKNNMQKHMRKHTDGVT